jgi:uncharacterized protein (TIGR02145 family)
MKKTKTIQILLVAALSGLSVVGYAQGKVCEGTTYEIREIQAPSDPSAYQWMEDGQEISGAVTAGYTVPGSKGVGKYTYVRRSKKEGCDWVSSNQYTVEVISCTSLDGNSAIGAKGSFQDPRDGKVYKTVKMPDGKIWFAENLNYQSGLTFNTKSEEANGVALTSIADGVPAIGSFWCPTVSGATLSADKNTCNVYGALYTWETAMSTDGKGNWDESTVSSYYNNVGTPAEVSIGPQVRGICPNGWHLPSDLEWATMLDAVDGSNTFTSQIGSSLNGKDGPAGSENEGPGVKMKSAATFSGPDLGNGAWIDSNYRGTDATGFCAVPAGRVNAYLRIFQMRGQRANFWSSSVTSHEAAIDIIFDNGTAQTSRWSFTRAFAMNVRCLKD